MALSSEKKCLTRGVNIKMQDPVKYRMTPDKLCQYESWRSRRTTITSDEAGTYGCRRPVPLSLRTAPFPLVRVVHPPVCSLDGAVRLPSLKCVSTVTGGRRRRGGTDTCFPAPHVSSHCVLSAVQTSEREKDTSPSERCLLSGLIAASCSAPSPGNKNKNKKFCGATLGSLHNQQERENCCRELELLPEMSCMHNMVSASSFI